MPKEFFRTSKRCKLLPCNSFSIAKLCLVVFSFLLCLYLSEAPLFANNLSVSRAALVDQNAGNDTVDIQFDVSWENSWRDATNYDAVWIFAKYCTDSCSTTGVWSHATLKTSGTNPSGFSSGTGTSLDIVVPADKKGAFLQRSGNGTGTVNASKVKLVWDYGADGVSDSDAVGVNTRIRVLGIEMVYVPTGSFSAGDGIGGSGQGNASFSENADGGNAWSILNEDALGVVASPYSYTSAGNGGENESGASFEISAAFPKGFAAFYMMKYEITQGQYRDFLNCLTREEQASRVASWGADCYSMAGDCSLQYRNGILLRGTPPETGRFVFSCNLNGNGVVNEATDGEWIAMNYMSWPDLAAYADWAALRPMTELEFEKAARGAGVTPVNLEYAWGTTNVLAYAYGPDNSGTSNEVSNNSASNINTFATFEGPARVGMFATPTSTTREQAGAGYYGAMELSGNVWERAVTVGNAAGRAFTGTHGDGVLGTAACATNEDWPGWSGGQVKDAWGSGFRGGCWDNPGTEWSTISARHFAAGTDPARAKDRGGRAVRTAP